MQFRSVIPFAMLVASPLASACSNGPQQFGQPEDAGADVEPGNDATTDGLEDAGRKKRVGEACAGPSECVEGAICIGTARGGFVCMQTCDTPYALCDDGSVCLPTMGEDTAICYVGGDRSTKSVCSTNLDCAAGDLCFGAGGEFYCRHACEDASDCDDGEHCLHAASGAGFCRAVVGAACASTPCTEGLTCSTDDPELIGVFDAGYCTAECESDDACPTRASCRELPAAGKSICLATCDHDSDCRFNAEIRCIGRESCAGSQNPVACEAVFADRRFCLSRPP